MTYTPAPINTSGISLSKSLIWIAEQLAENNHDVWAAQRLTEGWSYGTERNDQVKQTPCLVPYLHLREKEKNYDRNTSQETLKVILKLGYQIIDPEESEASRITASTTNKRKPGSGQTVMVFSGHMLDQPSRTEPRFPAELEDSVRKRIREKIIQNNGGIGYAAAAAGSDLLFLEEMIAVGGEIHIVLPIGIKDFKEQSVQAAGNQWLDRFDRILTQAASLTILDQYTKETFNNTLQFCNIYMFGLARLRAEQHNTNFCPLAVFDGIYLEGQLGGTSSMVEVWRRQQLPYSCVYLGEQADNTGVPVTAPLTTADRIVAIPGADGVQHHLCLTMLLLDFTPGGSMNEEEMTCALPALLKEAITVIKTQNFRAPPLLQRSTGHGLLLILEDFSDAVELADKLLTIGNSKGADKQRQKFPADLEIRLSLDAGSCYSYPDPLTEKREYPGRLVDRAATAQQGIPAGNILVSKTFAAFCRALGVEGISFEEAEDLTTTKTFTRANIVH